MKRAFDPYVLSFVFFYRLNLYTSEIEIALYKKLKRFLFKELEEVDILRAEISIDLNVNNVKFSFKDSIDIVNFTSE